MKGTHLPPVHDTPILGMKSRPRVDELIEYGNAASFWVEYPSGLVDLTRTTHASTDGGPQPNVDPRTQMDIRTDGDRVVRVENKRTALVVIDMQK